MVRQLNDETMCVEQLLDELLSLDLALNDAMNDGVILLEAKQPTAQALENTRRAACPRLMPETEMMSRKE
jgi:hypothetical protein